MRRILNILSHLPRPLKDPLQIAVTHVFVKSSLIARLSNGRINPGWGERIELLTAAEDNKHFKRHELAGQLVGNYVVMHNGVKVYANSYHGPDNLNAVIAKKGVHEPQEERVFERIIEQLPEEPVMLELGAYWAFYSLSLLNKRPNAKCFLVEPEASNLTCGKLNFQLNKRQGHFTHSLRSQPNSGDPTFHRC